MNQKYMKVSLFEISYKNLFHHIIFFLDVPVCVCVCVCVYISAVKVNTLMR